MGVGGARRCWQDAEAFGGRVGEKRAPSCKAGAAVTRGVGVPALRAPPRSLNPMSLLPFLSEPQPPAQEQFPCLEGMPGLSLDKSWLGGPFHSPTTPALRQELLILVPCSKSPVNSEPTVYTLDRLKVVNVELYNHTVGHAADAGSGKYILGQQVSLAGHHLQSCLTVSTMHLSP